MVDPTEFAEGWIDAWNAHDIEQILSHYASEIIFLSPLAERRTGSGRVEGINALRSYWEAGLAAQPGLHFELDAVLAGHWTLTILYRNHRQELVAETLEFGESGKAIRAFACYRPIS